MPLSRLGLGNAAIRFVLCAILALFFAGCGDTSTHENAAVEANAESASLLRSVNASLASGRPVSQEQIQVLKAFQEKYPNSTLVRDALVKVYTGRSDWAAIANLFESVDTATLSTSEKRLLGIVYANSGKYEKAIETLEPIAAENANDLDVRLALAKAQFYIDQPEKAASALDSVWSQIVDSKRVDAMTLRGLVHLRDNQPEKALEVLRTANEIDPNDVSANNALSRTYAQLGQTELAERHRQLTVSGQDRAVAQTREGSRMATNVVELEKAWNAQEYSKVVAIANSMLPNSNAQQRAILLQYIQRSHERMGNSAEAQKAASEPAKIQNNR